ncbi:hypothetical protein KPL70_003573 [Citrus sinensis]|nr:hypothetical protein KPL70_003573 [Citrus sinensis]
MVAEIFKELEELVARVELELLVRSIGIHETLKSWDGVSSMIANIGTLAHLHLLPLIPPRSIDIGATIELVLTEFATQFTSALRDWFDSLGHYRQLQFVQLPEVSSALAVIHDQFLGDPSAVFEAARRDYLNMKCCSLKAKDLNFHYKRMSLLFYKLNGFNEPTLKHIFLAFLPEELQLDIQRQLTASNLVLDNISLGKIFQLAKTCLDKLCEQKQFFKELLKDKEPFRSACKKPYLQIKCQKKKDCDCSSKKKKHFRKFKNPEFSSRPRRSRKLYRFFQKKSSSSRDFKRRKSSRCFICKRKDSDQSQVIFHQQLLSLDTTVPIPSIKLQLLPSKFQRPVPAIGLIDTGAQRRSHEEYRQLLTQFYDIFQSHGIMLSAKKSTIATNNIEFLDASDESWGAILLEEINGKEHFIAYASRQFFDTQKHYHSVFKEIFAVKNGIKKFEYHLIGHHFLIRMDSSAFPNILNFKGLTLDPSRETTEDVLWYIWCLTVLYATKKKLQQLSEIYNLERMPTSKAQLFTSVFIIHKPYFQHPDTNLFWTQDQAYEWFTAPHPAVIDNEIQSNVHNYLCQLNHQTPPHKDIFHTSLGPQHDLIMIPTPSAISKPKSTGIIIKEEKPDYTDFLYQDLQDPWEEFLPLSQHLQQFPQPTMYEPGSSSQPSKVDKATQIPSPKSQSSPSKPRCRRDCLIHLAVVPTDRGPVLSLRILLYKGFSHRLKYALHLPSSKDPVHQKPYDDFLNGLAQRENFSFMASTSSSTPVTLSSTLSLPKSCTSHTANKIENLVEYSYIPESTQISESSYPLISPYQLYKRPSSFTRSIRTLISTRRPHPKEYIQSSHLDQCALQATSAEQYVTLEIPSELLSNWKREGYTHLHLGGIRLILTLHRRKGLPVTARLAMLDTRFKQYQDAVIGTVLTTLHAGSVLLTFYPNFNLSLQDPNLPTTPESPSSDPRLQNHALDFPTPEHHSDTLMVLVESDQIPTIIQILRQIPRHELIKLMPLEWISNYEQFHNNTAPIQTSESMFERRQDGTVRMTFKPPPSAPQEPPRLFFTYSSMITAVQTAQENLPITRFNSNGYPVYPAKQNGHFLWDVPGSGMCDPNCPCWDDWEEDDDYVTTRKKKPKKKKSPVSCHHCDPKPPQDPPPPPAPLPFYKKELKWIATHCKSETPSSIPLPTPPLACMMFSSTSSDYSSSFPPLEPHTDSQRNVVSKPFIPSAITSTGHLEPAKPFESVLNWQTQNARA